MDPIVQRELAGLLLRIEQTLDEEISLSTLAREAGYSPYHFHRWFSARLGETPRQYVERIRLERAAYVVAVSDAPLTEIGFALGFRSPETFLRAFRRRYGRSPSDYRRSSKVWLNERKEMTRGFEGDGCRISEVRFVRLPRSTHIMLRKFGTYDQSDLPPFCEKCDTWTVLEAWAKARGVAYRREPWGFYPDNPHLTPPGLQRMDVCLPVDGAVEGEGEVRRFEFAGGPYAVVEHFGPFETISQAYTACADGIRRSDRWKFAEGPPLQVFRRWGIDGDPAQNLCEVAFPVLPKR